MDSTRNLAMMGNRTVQVIEESVKIIDNVCFVACLFVRWLMPEMAVCWMEMDLVKRKEDIIDKRQKDNIETHHTKYSTSLCTTLTL